VRKEGALTLGEVTGWSQCHLLLPRTCGRIRRSCRCCGDRGTHLGAAARSETACSTGPGDTNGGALTWSGVWNAVR
jgi:hypothetical protein